MCICAYPLNFGNQWNSFISSAFLQNYTCVVLTCAEAFCSKTWQDQNVFLKMITSLLLHETWQWLYSPTDRTGGLWVCECAEHVLNKQCPRRENLKARTFLSVTSLLGNFEKYKDCFLHQHRCVRNAFDQIRKKKEQVFVDYIWSGETQFFVSFLRDALFTVLRVNAWAAPVTIKVSFVSCDVLLIRHRQEAPCVTACVCDIISPSLGRFAHSRPRWWCCRWRSAFASATWWRRCSSSPPRPSTMPAGSSERGSPRPRPDRVRTVGWTNCQRCRDGKKSWSEV